MRIKTMDDVRSLGESAKKQIDALLKQQGGFDNAKRANSVSALRKSRPKNDVAGYTGSLDLAEPTPKRNAPSRVMRTEDGVTYCPYPSPDPFVAVIQRLATKYGIFGCGGMLLTELIIDGDSKNWRFDIALISPFELVDIQGKVMYLGYACLVHVNPKQLLKMLHSAMAMVSNHVTVIRVLHEVFAARYAKVLQGAPVCG